MKRLYGLYKKVNGKEILRQYATAHVLYYALMMLALLGTSRKSLEILRLAVSNKILKRLRKKYRKSIIAFQEKELGTTQKIRSSPRKVWVCWFQGMENAPDIVKRCYRSLQENIQDREIVLITEQNYMTYVQFPEFIKEKIDSGVISKTHASDLLRLELLIRYGGTWIDATVYCSGKPEAYMLDSDLFFFQSLKPGVDGQCTCASNWFITSESSNKVLRLTRYLLYQYWKEHDSVIDYFIFHYFFQLALESFADDWQKVIPFSNSVPHILLLRMFQPYCKELWNAVTEITPFHKLSYKIKDEDILKENTIYQRILEKSS